MQIEAIVELHQPQGVTKMNNFSIEAFAMGCTAATAGGQNRAQATRQLFETYIAYLQQQKGRK